MSIITISVSNLILVGLQFTHEILFHHFETLSLLQGIASEFTNSKYLTISLYACVSCKFLDLRVSLERFSSLSISLFVAQVLLFLSFFKSCLLPSIMNSSSKNERRYNAKYKT